MIYVVSYGGGLGPDVWDAEIEIEADNIERALKKAMEVLQGENKLRSVQRAVLVESVFSIIQKD